MQKRLLIIFSIVAVVLLSGYVYTRYSLQKSVKEEEQKTNVQVSESDTLGGKKVSEADLRPLFIQKLKQLINSSTNGLYELNVGDLDVDILASSVVFSKVTVDKNKTVLQALKERGELPKTSFNVSFQSLIIEGINLDEAITSKTMDYKLVKLVNPVITIEQHKSGKEEKEGDFTQNFLKKMEKLSIQNILVQDGMITIENEDKKQRPKKLNNVEINMNDILIDESTRLDKTRFFFAKKANISFKNYTSQSSDGLYHFQIGDVHVAATEKHVKLKNLSYGSHLNKKQFTARQKWATEMYNLQLSSVDINNVDWWALVNGQEVVANELIADGVNLSVYLSRSLPSQTKKNVVPNQALMKLPTKLNIKNLRVRDMELSYEEYNPLSKKRGIINFSNVTLDAKNFANDGSKSPFTVNASANFMKQIPMQVQFTFDMLNHKSGAFTAAVSMNKNFKGAFINSFAAPLGLLKLEEGEFQKLQANIKGVESKATGNISLTYKDLKVSLLEKDKDKEQLDNKSLKTIFANTFVLKKDNPKNNNALRREKAEYVRQPGGGFFNLVWKTILVGILKTIGAPEKLAY